MDVSTGVFAASYGVATLIRARMLLRERMTEVVCTACDDRRCAGLHVPALGGQYARMARGAFRARTTRDVLRSVWRGLWWPFWLVWQCFLLAHAAVTWAVLFASRLLAPATDAERARAYAEATARVEQTAEQLERDTRQLDAPGRPSPRPRKTPRHAAAGADQADAMEAGEILRALHIGAPLTNDQLAGSMAVLMRLLHARRISVNDVRRLAGFPELAPQEADPDREDR